MDKVASSKCTIFPDGNHVVTFDTASAGTVNYYCICGEVVTVYEDSAP